MLWVQAYSHTLMAKLKMFVMDKHSSLLRHGVNDEEKKFFFYLHQQNVGSLSPSVDLFVLAWRSGEEQKKKKCSEKQFLNLLVQNQMDNRRLAFRHLADRQLPNRYLTNRHLAYRLLAY